MYVATTVELLAIWGCLYQKLKGIEMRRQVNISTGTAVKMKILLCKVKKQLLLEVPM